MPLPTSKRQAALADLVTRLEKIQVTKGYNSDVGLSIFQGETPRGGEDDPTSALAIIIADDSPTVEDQRITSEAAFEVHALVRVGTAQPLVAAEAIIADIKEAVELTEDANTRTLGVIGDAPSQSPATTPKGLRRGVTRALRREEGSEYVGAVVEYVATFEEQWGGGGL